MNADAALVGSGLVILACAIALPFIEFRKPRAARNLAFTALSTGALGACAAATWMLRDRTHLTFGFGLMAVCVLTGTIRAFICAPEATPANEGASKAAFGAVLFLVYIVIAGVAAPLGIVHVIAPRFAFIAGLLAIALLDAVPVVVWLARASRPPHARADGYVKRAAFLFATFWTPAFALFGVPPACIALLPDARGNAIAALWLFGCFAALIALWMNARRSVPHRLDAKRAEQLRMDPDAMLR